MTTKIANERYVAKKIRADVEADVERLFAPWAVGRPEGWTPGPETKLLIALGYWMNEELAKFYDDDSRRAQIAAYNRFSRTYDIWETAASLMNDALDGNVEKNRRGHRRWG